MVRAPAYEDRSYRCAATMSVHFQVPNRGNNTRLPGMQTATPAVPVLVRGEPRVMVEATATPDGAAQHVLAGE